MAKTSDILQLRFEVDGDGKVKASLVDVKEGLGGVEKGVGAASRALPTFKSALAALGVGALLNELKNTAIQLERINTVFRAGTGDSQRAAAELSFVREQANRLGLEYTSLAENYGRVLVASRNTNLTQQETREIFLSVAEAASVYGLSQEEVTGALRAFEQMLSKGKVSAEELRGQLGERLPGAYQLAAKAMGVTTAELDKMVVAGEVMAEDLLPRLAVELRKAVAADVPAAIDSTAAAFNRLDNSMTDLKESVANSGLTDAMVSLANFVSQTFIPAMRHGLEEIGYLQVQINQLDLGKATVSLEDAQAKLRSMLVSLESVKRSFGAGMWEISPEKKRWDEDIKEQEQLIAKLEQRIKLLGTTIQNTPPYDPGKPPDVSGHTKYIEALQQELAVMQLVGREQEVQKELDKAHAKGVLDQDEAIRKLVGTMFDLKAAQDKTKVSDAMLKDMQAELSVLSSTGKELEVQKALREAHAKGVLDQDEAIRKLVGTMYDLKTAQDRTKLTNDYLGRLREELSLSKLTGKELAVQTAIREAHAKGIQDQDAAIRSLVEATYDQQEAQRKLTDQTERDAQIYKDFATGIYEGMRDAFRGMLDDGKFSLDRLGDMFKDWLANMITMALARPIIVPIITGLGGLLGMSSSALAAATSQLGGAAGGAAAGAAAGGGGGAGLFGLGAMFSGFGSGMSAFFTGGANHLSNMMVGSTSSAIGYGLAGVGTGMLSGNLINNLLGGGGSTGQTNTLSAIGGGIGAALGGPLGALIGGAIGGLASNMLGGAETVLSRNLNLNIAGTSLSGQTVTRIKEDGGWFGDDDYRTNTRALDSSLDRALEQQLAASADQLRAFAESLGITTDSLDSFRLRTTINLQGLNEQAVKDKIAEFMLHATEEMARLLFPGLDSLREEGESAAEAIGRIVQQIGAMREAAMGLDAVVQGLNFQYMLRPKQIVDTLREQFFTLLDEAQGLTGDDLVNAAVQLQQMAPALLDQARGVFASGGDFQSLFTLVTAGLQDISTRLGVEVGDITDQLTDPSAAGAAGGGGLANLPGQIAEAVRHGPPIYLSVSVGGSTLYENLLNDLWEMSSRGEVVIHENGIATQ